MYVLLKPIVWLVVVSQACHTQNIKTCCCFFCCCCCHCCCSYSCSCCAVQLCVIAVNMFLFFYRITNHSGKNVNYKLYSYILKRIVLCVCLLVCLCLRMLCKNKVRHEQKKKYKTRPKEWRTNLVSGSRSIRSSRRSKRMKKKNQ